MTQIRCRRLAFLLGFAIVSIFLSTTNAQAQNTYVTEEGATIEVSIRPEKEKILLGEQIYVIFEIRNRSNKTFTFFEGGDYRNRLGRPESYKISAIRKDGKEVPVPKIDFSFGGLGANHEVPAHDRYQRKLFLPLWAPFEEPGEYRITLHRYLPLKETEGQSESSKGVEAETTLIVLPPDEEKMRKVIAEIGRRILSSDYEVSRDAVYAMTFIKDRRTIPFFVRILQEAEKAEPNRFPDQNVRNSAAALIGFPDDAEALAGISTAATSEKDELRFAIAYGLWMWLMDARDLRAETRMQFRRILEPLSKDKSENIGKAARNALATEAMKEPK